MSEVKIKRYWRWFWFLGTTMTTLGFFTVQLIGAPLCILGFVYRPAWVLATRVNRSYFKIVLWLQPWWNAQIDIQLPEEVKNEELGCLTISNHRSHLDAFVIMSQICSVRLIAKTLIFFMPPYGHMVWLLKGIGIRRANIESYWRAMEKVRKGLENKDRIHVFPEGTRCKEGSVKLGRFHSAPFKVAMDTQVPVLPIVFWGTDTLWCKGSQKIASSGRVVVKSLPPLWPKNFSSTEELMRTAKFNIEQAQLQMSQEIPFGS